MFIHNKMIYLKDKRNIKYLDLHQCFSSIPKLAERLLIHLPMTLRRTLESEIHVGNNLLESLMVFVHTVDKFFLYEKPFSLLLNERTSYLFSL